LVLIITQNSKSSKFSPAAQKKEEIWLRDLPKSSKFSPAAQKKEEIWLKDLPKSTKFSPAAQKSGFFGVEGAKKVFADF